VRGALSWALAAFGEEMVYCGYIHLATMR